VAKKYNTSTVKNNCPWRADVFRVSDSDAPDGYIWAVRVTEPRHNHEGVRNPSSVAVIRQDVRREAKARAATTDTESETVRDSGIMARVEDLSATCTMTARVIAEQLTREFGLEEAPMTTNDVKYMQRMLRKQKYGPYSATQLFVDILQNDRESARHCKIHRSSKTGKINGVAWTYDSAIELLKRFHQFNGFDCTYKVGNVWSSLGFKDLSS
jgi:hypothetical protein